MCVWGEFESLFEITNILNFVNNLIISIVVCGSGIPEYLFMVRMYK